MYLPLHYKRFPGLSASLSELSMSFGDSRSLPIQQRPLRYTPSSRLLLIVVISSDLAQPQAAEKSPPYLQLLLHVCIQDPPPNCICSGILKNKIHLIKSSRSQGKGSNHYGKLTKTSTETGQYKIKQGEMQWGGGWKEGQRKREVQVLRVDAIAKGYFV